MLRMLHPHARPRPPAPAGGSPLAVPSWGSRSAPSLVAAAVQPRGQPGAPRTPAAAAALAVPGVAAAALAGRRRCRGARGRWPGGPGVRRAAAGEADERALTVLVPVADDSEEIETACITDVLVRAGAEVTVASVGESLQVRMSRGLKVVADVKIGECVGRRWDAIACPGGMPGAARLRDCEELTALLREQRASGRVTAAVCASPAVVFATHGLLAGSATCYPAPQFKEQIGTGWQDAQAVVDGNVITSQGPGTSLQFALKIVEVLYGRPKAEELAGQMVTHLA